ncbi:MAG: RCC1 domain-containing protein [Promicromonosporaceae bacterium]|nr:RCC1 domain-containing protein [Promicromonosporaceae bacterium]
MWQPVTVTPNWAPATVVKLVAFNAGGYVIDSDGIAWGWGYGATGAMGDGSTANRLLPVRVGGTAPMARVVVGPRNSATASPSTTRP